MPFQKNKINFKGRGAQVNTNNRFQQSSYVTEYIEGVDEEHLENSSTEFLEIDAKSIVSTSSSPDLRLEQSINPYQGCEHGCLYCYARNSHEYWGFSAGLDFERKIIVKRNSASLLEKFLRRDSYDPHPIMLSGNTDCYQPAEQKYRITRSLLEIFLKYKHPVSLITKNTLIERDIDLLEQLNSFSLVNVVITINSLNENLRRKLEPRTVTAEKRLKLISSLSQSGIPVRLMIAPIIPGLNSEEIPTLIKAAAHSGARSAMFTMVRLNGSIAEIFTDWLYKAFPDRADKVIHGIQSCHGGKLNDSQWGRRMVGDGKLAESIHQLFKMSVQKYMAGRIVPELNCSHFLTPNGKQLEIFK